MLSYCRWNARRDNGCSSGQTPDIGGNDPDAECEQRCQYDRPALMQPHAESFAVSCNLQQRSKGRMVADFAVGTVGEAYDTWSPAQGFCNIDVRQPKLTLSPAATEDKLRVRCG